MHRTILNTTKQQWMTIGIVLLAVIVVYYVFLRKKKAESNWTIRGGVKPGGPTRPQEGAEPNPMPKVREQSDCNLIKGCLEDYSRRMLEIQNKKVPFIVRQMMYKKNGASFINCIGCGN